MKRLILCGDSWAWGYEVLPSHLDCNQNATLGYDVHSIAEAEKFRLENRYGAILGKQLQMEVVDLSECGAANKTIIRKLLDYLSKEGYFSNTDTKTDILVTIGWTSPARAEMFDANEHRYYTCNTHHDAIRHKNENSNLGNLFEQYFLYSCHEKGYSNSWTQEVFQLYKLLEYYKIPFMMHQAFYQMDILQNQGTSVLEANGIRSIVANWKDYLFWNKVDEGALTTESKILWNTIDKKHFLLKEENKIVSMNEYLNKHQPDINKAYGITHPNALGHSIWAEYMISHIEKYNLVS
jgi:hypothetical protein